MLTAKTKNIVLSDKRFAAREHIKMRSKLNALIYDIINFIICEIEFMAVFRCPAAFAIHVTCTCRVNEHQPRNVALVFFTICPDGSRSVEACTENERQKHFFEIIPVDILKQIHRIGVPNVIVIAYRIAETFKCLFGKCFTCKLFGKTDKLENILFRILVNVLQHSVKQKAYACSLNIFFQ